MYPLGVVLFAVQLTVSLLLFHLWCISRFCGTPGTKKNLLDGKTIADMRRKRKCWPKFRPHQQKKPSISV